MAAFLHTYVWKQIIDTLQESYGDYPILFTYMPELYTPKSLSRDHLTLFLLLLSRFLSVSSIHRQNRILLHTVQAPWGSALHNLQEFL